MDVNEAAALLFQMFYPFIWVAIGLVFGFFVAFTIFNWIVSLAQPARGRIARPGGSD